MLKWKERRAESPSAKSQTALSASTVMFGAIKRQDLLQRALQLASSGKRRAVPSIYSPWRAFSSGPKSASYEAFKQSMMSSPTLADPSSGSNSVSSMEAALSGGSGMDMNVVSPEVLSIMINEALDRNDHKTLRLLLIEAKGMGKLDTGLTAATFAKCFTDKDDQGQTERLAKKESAAFILQMGGEELERVVSEKYMQELLGSMVNHCLWFQAAAVAERMVRRGDAFVGDREVFFISAGLMKSSLGVDKVVDLLSAIAQYRRSDLATLFSYTKINRFSLSVGSGHGVHSAVQAGGSTGLDGIKLRSLAELLLVQLKEHGWFSFSMSKTLVALACSSQNHDLAAEYVTRALEETNMINSRGRIGLGSAEQTPVDLLSMLRAFSQAAGIASADNDSYKGQDLPSPLSRILLDLSAHYLRGQVLLSGGVVGGSHTQTQTHVQGQGQGEKLDGEISLENVQLSPLGAPFMEGPLKGADFLKMYWVLAQREGRQVHLQGQDRDHTKIGSATSEEGEGEAFEGKGALGVESISDSYPRQKYVDNSTSDSTSGDSKGNSANNAQGAFRTDPALQSSYQQLVAFLSDSSSSTMSSSPSPGHSRRQFRYLCDELGLKHKVEELLHEKAGGVGDTYGVRVWKDRHHSRQLQSKPPSLQEILRRDALRDRSLKSHSRRFGPPPRHWGVVRAYLRTLDTRTISAVCAQLTMGMQRAYPSAEWGLLVSRVLQDEDIPFPSGFLRNLMNMAQSRSDLYGLLEVLYANKEGDENSKRQLSSKTNQSQQQSLVYGLSEAEAFAAGLHVPSWTLSLQERQQAQEVAQAQLEMQSEQALFQTEQSYPYPQTDADHGSGLGGEAGGRSEYDAGMTGGVHNHNNHNEAHTAGSYNNYSNAGDNQTNNSNGRQLRQRDWNRACQAAYNCRLSDLPRSSFREGFTELMSLMREGGVELDDNTMRTLLRFLVYTEPRAELTWRILKRINRDKNVRVGHIECAALSWLIMGRLPALRDETGAGRLMTLARPAYKVSNYLFVYPAAQSFIENSVVQNAEFLGQNWLNHFENAWENVHSEEGSAQLYTLMKETLAPETEGGKGKRELLLAGGESCRQCMMVLSLYAAYLVGARGIPVGNGTGTGSGVGMGGNGDGNSNNNGNSKSTQAQSFRSAFDLLYEAETMYQEAEKLEQDQDQEQYEEEDEEEEEDGYYRG